MESSAVVDPIREKQGKWSVLTRTDSFMQRRDAVVQKNMQLFRKSSSRTLAKNVQTLKRTFTLRTKLAEFDKFIKNRRQMHRGSTDSSLSSDGQDEAEGVLNQAFTHTRQFRVKSMIANALVMEQKNKVADMNRVGLMKKRADANRVKSKFAAAFQPKMFHIARKLPVSPYVKFRRMVRAVKLLIQVCHVCSDLVMKSVTSESWFALMDNIVVAGSSKAKKKRDRQFITFVPNENRELEQLTFDVNDFKRDSLSEELLTDEVKAILEKIPGTRSADDVVKVLRCLKAISRPFNNYPLNVQKQISQYAFYDKYKHNRVIIKKGHIADGMFFLLSGSLMEKADGKKHPYHINIGDIFGEEDLICGSYRRHTVITRMPSEMLYVYREDYREIFEMAEDANDPKNLDICKQNLIFQHFPLNRLIENPSTWSTLQYKHGRCIVKDSNDVEWIYVIRSSEWNDSNANRLDASCGLCTFSHELCYAENCKRKGEARIFKRLDTTTVDITARRKKVQKAEQEQCVFYKRRQILDFEANRDQIKSAYRPTSYHPGRRLNSAPPTNGHRCRPEIHGCQSLPATPALTTPRRSSTNLRSPTTPRRSPTTPRRVQIPSVMSSAIDEISKSQKAVTFPRLTTDDGANHLKPEVVKISSCERTSDGGSTPRKESGYRSASVVRKTSFIRTPIRRKLMNSQQSASTSATVPPFVQIETLHSGDVFGLRACLDPEERGPSVSLVSGECEVVQINKKFFMKHCDDALYSLIRLKVTRWVCFIYGLMEKAKPYPTQEECIDRLDANIQWDEYKQETLRDFYNQQRLLSAR